eukprot:CAMPEP_0184009120 /NCGR_PEP_ID=MMETSP0954-20121128/2405_1 /TAXON_ID=627963 /ORGANISM="Aplanochytrium sp, Strain PBS07" /LENGTH=478 /DNA_ID=CAMNT_0026288411 /DNA_START=135 /DNA_END=1571 /DNA_ORIENTATION=+
MSGGNETIDTVCSRGYNYVTEHSEVSKSNKIRSTLWLVFANLYMLFWIFVYLRRRKESSYLRRRTRSVFFVFMIGCLFQPWLSLKEVIGRENYPCILVNMVPIFAVNLIAWSIVMRIFLYHYRIEYYKAITRKTYFDLVSAWNADKQGETILEPETETESKPSTLSKKSARTDGGHISVHTLKRLRLFASERFAWVILVIHFVGTTLLLGYTQDAHLTITCIGCEFDVSNGAYVAAYALVLASIVGFTMHRLRNESDSLGLKFETNLGLVISFPVILAGILLSLLDPGNKERDGEYFWGRLMEIAGFLLFTVSVPYQVYVSYFFDVKASSRGKGAAAFNTLMTTNNTERDLFKLYLATELSTENYHFWHAVNDWKTIGNQNLRNAKSCEIYDTFICQSSASQVNVSSTVYQSIKEKISNHRRSGADIEPDIFDRAFRDVHNMLAYGAFTRFEESALYKRYESTDEKTDLPSTKLNSSI